MKLVPLVAGMMLLALPCRAQEIRQFDIPTLEKLGQQIYAQDQAAWHATDALALKYPNFRQENIRGWIVVERPQGLLVRFIRLGDAGQEAAYDVSEVAGKPVVSVPADRQLSTEEKAMFAARSFAIASIPRGCAETWNTVVLKDPQGDGWLAWALAATTDPNLIVVLGHRRLTVAADGSKVLRTDALSRSCGAMSKTEPGGKEPVGLMMTQLVSDLPVETYVFLSLQHDLLFYVGTSDKAIWQVQKGKIRKLDKTPDFLKQ